jgi:SAM-dependent methyltransferase
MHVTAVEAYDFGAIGTLVDVGGGHGRLLAKILRRHPKMRGIVFDRPGLSAAARNELARMGLADRCDFVGGDFLESVPPGGDAYIMSHTLHNWPDAEALAILRNCRNALPAGGKVLVLEAVINEGNEPDWGKLMDLEMLMMFGGRDRTSRELSQLFREARFELTRVIPTRSTTSIVEGIAI